jgi:hypothetical protein
MCVGALTDFARQRLKQNYELPNLPTFKNNIIQQDYKFNLSLPSYTCLGAIF